MKRITTAVLLTLASIQILAAPCPPLSMGITSDCPANDSTALSYYNANKDTPPRYWMVGAQLGYNWPGSQLEASLIYGAHVGYRFGYQFFSTVSFDHFNAKYENNKAFSVQENIIQANFEFVLTPLLTDNFDPYVGLGAGMNLFNHKTPTNSSGSAFAWNLNIGALFTVDKNLALGLSYRFIASSGHDNNSNSLTVHNNVISGSLTLLF